MTDSLAELYLTSPESAAFATELDIEQMVSSTSEEVVLDIFQAISRLNQHSENN